ncbi:MAG: type II toxin-antitoxin system HicB family antitoxin, partial [Clostridiales bacterium]|nr:type II toxin-antitoxin system HicB family antitoxin [Clostridiales bacterium]
MNKDLNYYMGLNYRIEVIEDKQEGGYALSCPELRGCITCADTIENGLSMIEDAKKNWFAAC